jgi:calcineurin-like phosphoesterase family protein
MLAPPFYVVSDTHFFHKRIVDYCGRDMNHNNIMVERWNKAVGPNDVVLHLGDLVFTTNANKQRLFFESLGPSLHGQKYLILGNHDRKDWERFYVAAGFAVIRPFSMQYKGYTVSFDHYPANQGAISKGDDNIRVHGHIHNNGYQNVHVKRKQMKRYGNINTSVEVIDYTPQPIERLLDKTIAEMKPKQHYVNIQRKNGTSQALRHAA